MAAYAFAAAEEEDTHEPLTYQEAVAYEDSSKWKAAMEEEMDSLRKNKTWELVDHLAGQKLVSCKWLFKIKEGIECVQRPRYKARLVARRFTQRAEVIYMRQPPGYEQGNKVCLLKKSLYGLKQSPRQWYRRFDEYMLSNGFKRSSYDSCVYYKSYAPGEYIYLLLYVDDMLISCKSKAEIGSTKTLLKREFDMEELGEAKKILGMEIIRDRSRKIPRVSQYGYVSKILNNFRIDNKKSVQMPLGVHFKLSLKDCPIRDCDVERMSKVPYANVVGSLMYLMVCTRPDIAYEVSIVSRYLANPGKNHWEAVKWILKYLRGTANVGLVYGTNHSNHVDVTCFVDSDYAKDPNKGSSITAYAFLVQGCVVSWKATLQHVVALLTTEAEYMALTEAAKEAIWVRGLLEELGVELNSVAVNCDNQGAIHLSQNHVFHKRTKHINVRYHLIIEVLEAKMVEVLKVGTEHNVADALTKVIPELKLQHCLEVLSVALCYNNDPGVDSGSGDSLVAQKSKTSKTKGTNKKKPKADAKQAITSMDQVPDVDTIVECGGSEGRLPVRLNAELFGNELIIGIHVKSRGKSRSKSQGGRLKCYICQSEDHLKRNSPKNNCKKLTGYVNKDDQPSSSGSIYEDMRFFFGLSGNAMGGMFLLGGHRERKIRGLASVLEEKSSVNGSSVVLSGTRRIIAYTTPPLLDGHAMALRDGTTGDGKAGFVWQEESRHTTQGVIDYVHSDLWGPSQVESLGGKRYFLYVVDDCSRRVWVYILRFKHEAFEKFKEWKKLVENQTGRTVKKLRTDNGLELCNQEFKQLCIKSGIARHLIVVGTLQQNGLAERMNRTLMDKIKEGIKGVQRPRYKARLVAHGFTQRAGLSIAVTTAVYITGVMHQRLCLKAEVRHEELREVKEKKFWYGDHQGSKSQDSKGVTIRKIKVAVRMGWELNVLDGVHEARHSVCGFVDLDYAKDPNKEAEYMALTKAVKEAIWLRGLLEELGVELNSVAVNCDNQGTIHLSQNHVFHERTKHINVRYHFIIEVLEAKMDEVLKVGTKHNAADALTKMVPGHKLQHCLELLSVALCYNNDPGVDSGSGDSLVAQKSKTSKTKGTNKKKPKADAKQAITSMDQVPDVDTINEKEVFPSAQILSILTPRSFSKTFNYFFPLKFIRRTSGARIDDPLYDTYFYILGFAKAKRISAELNRKKDLHETCTSSKEPKLDVSKVSKDEEKRNNTEASKIDKENKKLALVFLRSSSSLETSETSVLVLCLKYKFCAGLFPVKLTTYPYGVRKT
ncbi:retrovirus-related pol polyprotein from transposon TNT 1-94 [Tanacetum coccineum]